MKQLYLLVAKGKTLLAFTCLALLLASNSCEDENLEPAITEQTGNNPLGSGSGGAVVCSGDYDGPEFNVQVDSQCKMAYAYQCSGNEAGRRAACQLYYEWKDSWTGSGSFPECPYCD